jgi:hypothetical protein
MYDLNQLKHVVLARTEALAAVRLKNLDWTVLEPLTREELAARCYQQGAEDALEYLGHLLETKAEA